MSVSESDRIKGASVPLRLSEELEVRLKFNMLSSWALEKRYGEATPLVVFARPPEVGGAVERLAFIIAAACLHPAGGMDANLEAIKRDETTAEAEAQRLSRQVLVAMEDPGGSETANAIARAIDIASPLPLCANDASGTVCGHAFSDHDWVSDRCTECECALYQTPGVMEAKRIGDTEGKVPAAPGSTGPGIPTPPLDTVSAVGTSG